MNDLVFKTVGEKLELVGNFEGLYQAEGDPWQQSCLMPSPMAEYYMYSRSRVATAILMHQVTGAGIEFGCGLGYSTRFFALATKNPMMGVDVSVTAVLRAMQLHPELQFGVGDITSRRFQAPYKFDFAIMGQMLWYVLENIDVAVANSLSCLKPGGMFIISQAFLKDKQLYGAEIADGFPGALRLFMDRFSKQITLINAAYDDTGTRAHNDGLLMFRNVGS